jgi:Domain of unknown function (DUF4123)
VPAPATIDGCLAAAEAVLFGADVPVGGLFSMVDAAQDDRIYPWLRGAGPNAEILPLYEGAAASDLAGVAPYLIGHRTADRLFRTIWGAGWGQSWGIFVVSPAPASEVRGHFRRIVRVRSEDGKALLFRFYDPRVLGAFVPVCNPEQWDALFGPVTQFFVERRSGTVLERFVHVQGLVYRQFHALDA